MSAPPLPEIFGNYALGDFVEVVAPAAVGWLPQTTGWLWLGAALLALLLQRAYRRLRRWYADRYRREASRRLRNLGSPDAPATLIPAINELLKITAIAGYSRERVARLSGSEWVEFLNQGCAAPPFDEELGQWLAAGSYREIPLQQEQGRRLVAACDSWIRQHEGNAGV